MIMICRQMQILSCVPYSAICDCHYSWGDITHGISHACLIAITQARPLLTPLLFFKQVCVCVGWCNELSLSVQVHLKGKIDMS